jgi:hypothetical protein
MEEIKEEDKGEDEDEDEDKQEDRLDAPLDKADVLWLLDRAQGYNAYEIGESFVLFTKGHNDIREAPCLNVPGPYEIEDDHLFVRFNIEEAPKGESYTELFELACKFAPSGSKLSFAPGKYSFAATTSYMLKVKQLKRSDSSSHDTSKKRKAADIDAPATVPFDFELIVGSGEKKKTIGVKQSPILF